MKVLNLNYQQIRPYNLQIISYIRYGELFSVYIYDGLYGMILKHNIKQFYFMFLNDIYENGIYFI